MTVAPVTVDELRQRLVLFVRLHVAEHAETYADVALERLAAMIRRGDVADGAPTETLCLHALVLARSLVWEAKLQRARGESLEPSELAVAEGVPSARATLSAALASGAEVRESMVRLVAQPTRAALRDLLLHRLPELDAQRIEEQLLLDASVGNALRAEESDLLDDYSAARLTSDERSDVERFVLTRPGAHQRVKVNRALNEVRKRRAGHSNAAKAVGPWNRWSLRAAGAIVVCTLALVFYLMSMDDAVEPTPSSSRVSTPNAVASQIGVSPESPPAIGTPDDPSSDQASAPFNVLLLADQQRAFGAYPLSLTDDAVDVRLQAEVPFGDVTKRYQLSVRGGDGKPVFVASSVQPREAGGMVIVETLVPARALGAGMRSVVLSPVSQATPVATWSLDIQRDDP